MLKEHVPLSGTYVLTSDLRGKTSFEQIIRNTLRACGYPCISCNDSNCNNPDLCQTLTDLGCSGGGGTLDCGDVLTCVTDSLGDLLSGDEGNCLTIGTDGLLSYNCFGENPLTLNGISGSGVLGDEIVLGADLDRDTTIDGVNLWDFSLINSPVITLEAEAGVAGRLSKLTLTDNPILGAAMISQTDATLYSKLVLDPDASSTTLNAYDTGNQGNIVLSATGASMGVDPGQGGRRFTITGFTHVLTNLDTVSNPHTLDTVYVDTSDNSLYSGSRFQASDADNGLSVNGSTIELGGSLTQNTTVDATTAFNLLFTKDNVRAELVGTALPGGAGEAARFYGADGSTVAEVGIYTDSFGVPSSGSRSGTATLYNRIRHLPALDRLVLDAGVTLLSYGFISEMGSGLNQMGFQSGGTFTKGIRVENTTLGTTNALIQLLGLLTFANNADAVSGGLPVETIYKTASGELRIVV